MIFTPQTWVRLLSNIPLDNSYTHTMSFPDKSAQYTYFSKHTVHDFENFSYQRYNPDRGKIATIRVPIVADQLYNVNYLMFRNNNFGDKWFYAFVQEINYINDGMTELVYEIDIVQTWYFDYKIQPSFVVREHVNDDTKYKNYIEEDLDTGEYIVGNFDTYNGFKPENCYTVLAASFGLEKAPTIPGIIHIITGTLGYIYNELTYYAFEDDDTVAEFIKACVSKAVADGIITIFPYPKAMWPGNMGAGNTDVIKPSIQTVFDKGQQLETFGSYKPRNNKLYCFPYSFIYVTNNNGTTANYRYEFFKGRMAFAVCSCLSAAPDFYMCPMNYKQANNPGFNWNEGLASGPLPYGSWVTDVYKAYLAQNQSRLGAQMSSIQVGDTIRGINAVGQMASSLAASSPAGIIGGMAGGVTSLITSTMQTQQQIKEYMANLEDRARQPPQSNSVPGNETAFSLNLRNFGFYNMQITEEYAKKIDKYFDMFGYKVTTVKVPNITGRKSWNYVKTQGIQIIGNMPADDLSALCSIFDRGITFWHVDDVGNYNLDNGIVKAGG